MRSPVPSPKCLKLGNMVLCYWKCDSKGTATYNKRKPFFLNNYSYIFLGCWIMSKQYTISTTGLLSEPSTKQDYCPWILTLNKQVMDKIRGDIFLKIENRTTNHSVSNQNEFGFYCNKWKILKTLKIRKLLVLIIHPFLSITTSI